MVFLTCVEFHGETDHAHILIQYPPKIQLSKWVNRLKEVSRRKLKLHHPEVANRYYKSAPWSPNDLATSCGGAPLEGIKRLVEQQSTPL